MTSRRDAPLANTRSSAYRTTDLVRFRAPVTSLCVLAIDRSWTTSADPKAVTGLDNPFTAPD
jgi:hypothetical protein